MSSYNLIPFNDLTATGFTGTISTTAFTVNGATVTGEVDSVDFITPVFPTTQPMFTFASDQGTGIFSRTTGTTATTSLGFSVTGTIIAEYRLNTGVAGVHALFLGGINTPAQTAGFFGTNSELQISTDANNINGSLEVDTIFVQRVGTVAGLVSNSQSQIFGLINGVSTALLVGVNGNIIVTTTQLGSVWQPSETDATNFWHFSKPGLLTQVTTVIQPSTTRSNAHVNNLISGITTVFVTLPTSLPGLKYTVSNARAVANTVVVNPRAADTLQVFGLTKAAGVSVAANAPFSSITFHCVTPSQWVATKQTGAWV